MLSCRNMTFARTGEHCVMLTLLKKKHCKCTVSGQCLHFKCFSGQLDHSKCCTLQVSSLPFTHTHSCSGGGGYLCGCDLPIRAGSRSVQGSAHCSRTLRHIDAMSWCAAAGDRSAWPLWPAFSVFCVGLFTGDGGYDFMGSLTPESIFLQMTAFGWCLCFPSNVVIMIFVLMSDTVAVARN